jgi:hypothetical protein
MEKGKAMPTKKVTTPVTQEPSLVTPDAAKADPAATALRETATSHVTPEPAPIAKSPTILPALANAKCLHELRARYSGKLPYMAHVPAHHFETPNMIIRKCYSHERTVWKTPNLMEYATRFANKDETISIYLRGEGTHGEIGNAATIRAAYAAAYRQLRLAHYDKAALLRQNAELRAGVDALAEQVTELDCQVIKLQMGPAQWQKDVQALKEQVQLEKATADALREENTRLVSQLTKYQLAAQAAHKVRASTIVTLPDATAPEDK